MTLNKQKQEELIQEIIKLLTESNNTILTGYAAHAGNGIIIPVRINNTTQFAYSVNVTNPGQVSLVYCAKEKKWLAYQIDNRTIVSRNLITYRKNRITTIAPLVGYIKVLYSVKINPTTTALYIGGDRAIPYQVISFASSTNYSAYIHSTGVGIDDWIVGIYIESTSSGNKLFTLQVITTDPATSWQKQYTEDLGNSALSLLGKKYINDGVWVDNRHFSCASKRNTTLPPTQTTVVPSIVANAGPPAVYTTVVQIYPDLTLAYTGNVSYTSVSSGGSGIAYYGDITFATESLFSIFYDSNRIDTKGLVSYLQTGIQLTTQNQFTVGPSPPTSLTDTITLSYAQNCQISKSQSVSITYSINGVFTAPNGALFTRAIVPLVTPNISDKDGINAVYSVLEFSDENDNPKTRWYYCKNSVPVEFLPGELYSALSPEFGNLVDKTVYSLIDTTDTSGSTYDFLTRLQGSTTTKKVNVYPYEIDLPQSTLVKKSTIETTIFTIDSAALSIESASYYPP
jgi:hypothetical protein